MVTHINQFKDLRPLNDRDFEIVERKGLGHPDTICDALADTMSVELNKAYIKKYGTILHYNLDKILLTAGASETKFGGGFILDPIKIFLGDRATEGEEEGWVDDIIINAGKNWFKKYMEFSDVEHDVIFYSEVKSGSKNLQDIFKRKTEKYLGSNDTSATVGYYPMTDTEKFVKSLEQSFNSKAFYIPWLGKDIKIMAVRNGRFLHITMSAAFVDKYVDSMEDYIKKKNGLYQTVAWFGSEYIKETGADLELSSLGINMLDDHSRGIDGIFMTVNGTSAESGDSGQVGRGNDPNGFIPLCRPMASEAAPGKNPVSHVGKIYNALAFELAKDIYKAINIPRSEVYCWLVSQIGRPINMPMHVAVQINGGLSTDVEYKTVNEVINKRFDKLDEFCNRLANGEIKLW